METDHVKSIEAMLELSKQAFERFKHRGNSEWKTCISIWTVFVILLGLIVKGDIGGLNPISKPVIISATILVFCPHCNWIKGIAKAYGLDNRTQAFFFKKTLDLTKTDVDIDLMKEITDRTESSGRFWNWYHSFHAGITFLLATCVIVAILTQC